MNFNILVVVILLTLGLSAMFIEEFQQQEKSNNLRIKLQKWSITTNNQFFIDEIIELCTCKICGTRFFVTFLNLCVYLPFGWLWCGYEIIPIILLNQCLVYFYGLINLVGFKK